MNEVPKAMYLATYRANTGATYSVPVNMDKEIDTTQDYHSLVNTVSKYAVGQGHTRGLDDVTITGLTLLNPGRDVNVIANEVLEKAFVDLYNAHYESGTVLDTDMLEMYNAINGIEEVGQ
ncbi:hypothetical protein NVP1205O_69 [Vibrio phage 1.205.O._10N.222.51.A7]|nr:hypothetical protein NVP1205O_69 [Vibrio phage 1.205.O._10N.222.51.A7]